MNANTVRGDKQGTITTAEIGRYRPSGLALEDIEEESKSYDYLPVHIAQVGNMAPEEWIEQRLRRLGK